MRNQKYTHEELEGMMEYIDKDTEKLLCELAVELNLENTAALKMVQVLNSTISTSIMLAIDYLQNLDDF